MKYWCFLLLFVPLCVWAQPEQRQPVNVQYGFRVTSGLTPTRDITPTDHFDTEFGFYCRAGKRFYGELGVAFQYQRNTFTSIIAETAPESKTEFFETQFLPISARAVFYQPLNKTMAFLAHLGGAYHPLIKVTNNYLYYTKEDINSQLSIQAGVAYKVRFLVIEAAYKQMLLPYFKNKESEKLKYFTITLGVQLPY